jgi:hypothetical protein
MRKNVLSMHATCSSTVLSISAASRHDEKRRPCVRISFRNAANHDIPVGNDANQPVLLIDDRNFADILVQHDSCDRFERVAPRTAPRIARHDVTGLHGNLDAHGHTTHPPGHGFNVEAPRLAEAWRETR